MQQRGSGIERCPQDGPAFDRLPPPMVAAAAPAASAAPAVAGETMRSAGAGGKLTAVAGKTIKCDLCAGLPFEACVYNCPTTAILRREPQSLFGGTRGI